MRALPHAGRAGRSQIEASVVGLEALALGENAKARSAPTNGGSIYLRRSDLRSTIFFLLAIFPSGCSRCSFRRTPCWLLRRMLASVALRTSIGSRRMSAPSSSSKSNAYRNACGSFRRRRSTWKTATPRSSQHTTSPSIRHERTLRWLTASTISGKRLDQSLPRLSQQPDAHRIAPGHEPVAVVLDLVNPVCTAGACRRAMVGRVR